MQAFRLLTCFVALSVVANQLCADDAAVGKVALATLPPANGSGDVANSLTGVLRHMRGTQFQVSPESDAALDALSAALATGVAGSGITDTILKEMGVGPSMKSAAGPLGTAGQRSIVVDAMIQRAADVHASDPAASAQLACGALRLATLDPTILGTTSIGQLASDPRFSTLSGLPEPALAPVRDAWAKADHDLGPWRAAWASAAHAVDGTIGEPNPTADQVRATIAAVDAMVKASNGSRWAMMTTADLAWRLRLSVLAKNPGLGEDVRTAIAAWRRTATDPYLRTWLDQAIERPGTPPTDSGLKNVQAGDPTLAGLERR